MGASTRNTDSLSPTSLTCLTWQTPRNAPLPGTSSNPVQITHATAFTAATGGNTKAVADEGGWSSSRTVEETYAHLAVDPALAVALSKVWGESP